MNILKRSLSFLAVFFVLTSCVSRKKIVYFQNGAIEQPQKFQTIFKPNDLLQITVSAADMDAVKPFNLPSVAYSSTTNIAVGQPQQQSYLVDSEGFIDFPLLGRIKVGGLSRSETINLLKGKLDPDYIKNPAINIRVSNFTVTVLGDVRKPGEYIINDERVTILEAIGLAGDTNLSGKRNNVLVIRNDKEQFRLNLLSNDVFTSPAFYLQQNDVVYVEPNKASSQDAAYNKNAGLFVSIGSIIISLITILTR